MTAKRALLVVAAVAAVLVTWASARFARQLEGGAGAERLAADAGEDTERVTLRFFRNPAAAPAFSVRDLDGRELTSASLRGKVVILNFWATWCGPCRVASPIMQQLHDKYGERGLVVIGANMAERDKDRKPLKTKDKAEEYAKEHKFTYMFTYANDDFAKACQVSGIPTMLIVDRKGVVRKVQVGAGPNLFKDLETAVLPLLDDQAASR
jgi:cytochrome c biogenesis protein CcmG, thiol:disulfide interchange protein DsbE